MRSEKMKFNRIFLMILDSLGVGEAIDANNYDDSGSNTLGHIKDNYDLFIPNLKKLGFLNTINMDENEQSSQEPQQNNSMVADAANSLKEKGGEEVKKQVQKKLQKAFRNKNLLYMNK